LMVIHLEEGYARRTIRLTQAVWLSKAKKVFIKRSRPLIVMCEERNM
jgi:hypothetical protein